MRTSSNTVVFRIRLAAFALAGLALAGSASLAAPNGTTVTDAADCPSSTTAQCVKTSCTITNPPKCTCKEYKCVVKTDKIGQRQSVMPDRRPSLMLR